MKVQLVVLLCLVHIAHKSTKFSCRQNQKTNTNNISYSRWDCSETSSYTYDGTFAVSSFYFFFSIKICREKLFARKFSRSIVTNDLLTHKALNIYNFLFPKKHGTKGGSPCNDDLFYDTNTQKIETNRKKCNFLPKTAAEPAEKQQEKKKRKNRKWKTNKPKPYESAKILRTNTNRNIIAKSERTSCVGKSQANIT